MVKGIPGRERRINKDLEERAVIISLLHPFSTWKIFFSLPGRSLVSWNLSKVVMLSFLSSLQGQRLQEHESLKKTSPLFFYAVTVAPFRQEYMASWSWNEEKGVGVKKTFGTMTGWCFKNVILPRVCCGKIAEALIRHIMVLGLYPLHSGLSLKVINRSNVMILLFLKVNSHIGMKTWFK